MSWLSVTLIVAAQRADALSDALLACGANSVDTADADAGTAGDMFRVMPTGASLTARSRCVARPCPSSR